MDNNFSISY